MLLVGRAGAHENGLDPAPRHEPHVSPETQYNPDSLFFPDSVVTAKTAEQLADGIYNFQRILAEDGAPVPVLIDRLEGSLPGLGATTIEEHRAHGVVARDGNGYEVTFRLPNNVSVVMFSFPGMTIGDGEGSLGEQIDLGLTEINPNARGLYWKPAVLWWTVSWIQKDRSPGPLAPVSM